MSSAINNSNLLQSQRNVLKKILFITVLLSIFVITGSGVALVTLELWKNSLYTVYEQNVVPLQSLNAISDLTSDLRFRLSAVLSDRLPTAGSKKKAVSAAEELDKLWNDFETHQDTLLLNNVDFLKAKEGYSYTKSLINELVSAYDADNKVKLGLILDEKWPKVISDFTNPTHKIYEFQAIKIKQTYEDSKNLTQKIMFGLVFLIVVALLISGYALFFIFNFRSRAESIVNILSTLGSNVLGASLELNASADDLTSVSSKNRQAIHETSSALSEINSMVQMTSKNANRSHELATAAVTSIEDGEKAISSLTVSMENINTVTNTMVSQFDDINVQLEIFVKIFDEVAEKTKVINDIVFQTRLLSFNAAVEAARAGEYGKGFAVVAEEVGSLAQLSGTSSQEISAIINNGLEQVKRIAHQVKSHSVSVSKVATESASEGTKSAGDISTAFGVITRNVEQIRLMMSELNQSTGEQTKGIHEVNAAMQDINMASESSTKSVETTHNESAKLKEEAEKLFQIMADLEFLLKGTIQIKQNQLDV